MGRESRCQRELLGATGEVGYDKSVAVAGTSDPTVLAWGVTIRLAPQMIAETPSGLHGRGCRTGTA